ncbi:E3 ubiquitin-protein ligase PUB23-like [Dioscorea cayenensis subsp. rotundata]|uniref:U-box domain-containing protein n=1 Tax=Dioscorea cayennensis subsp. rotundata TaxID=55577 RepID=A0AB40CAF1_DIOCR|nr:E3 ubiquitin-protein ligase PUB23-like [Dioscorea cayenensis subsp. rotundata]
MDAIDIPPYFICPISLQIMEDPVTISSGISYERRSIDKWLSTYNHNTCPVTKQLLFDRSLIPNTTLLRLIQSWTAKVKRSKGHMLDASPSKTSFDVSKLYEELSEAIEPDLQLKCLKKIKSLIQEDDENDDRKLMMEKTGLAPLVTSLMMKASSLQQIGYSLQVISEAAIVLQLLNPSQETLRKITAYKKGKILMPLSLILQRGTHQARIHTALLLKSIFKSVTEDCKCDIPTIMFESLMEILKDQNSSKVMTMALLSVLMHVTLFGDNLSKVIEAGMISVLIELLVEEKEDRRKCEAMLYVIEAACKKAEGRAVVLGHPAGVAAVAGKILRVSQGVTRRSVKILLLLCKYCGGGGVVEEMMEVGAVAKVCMVVQVEGNRSTREKAKEILGLHLKTWNKFPCFPLNCMA